MSLIRADCWLYSGDDVVVVVAVKLYGSITLLLYYFLECHKKSVFLLGFLRGMRMTMMMRW